MRRLATIWNSSKRYHSSVEAIDNIQHNYAVWSLPKGASHKKQISATLINDSYGRGRCHCPGLSLVFDESVEYVFNLRHLGVSHSLLVRVEEKSSEKDDTPCHVCAETVERICMSAQLLLKEFDVLLAKPNPSPFRTIIRPKTSAFLKHARS